MLAPDVPRDEASLETSPAARARPRANGLNSPRAAEAGRYPRIATGLFAPAEAADATVWVIILEPSA